MNPRDSSWSVHPVRLNTGFAAVEVLHEKSIAPLLVLFFRYFVCLVDTSYWFTPTPPSSFWRAATANARKFVLSVRENKYLPRQHVTGQWKEPVTYSNRLSTPDSIAYEPRSWQFDRLVVQDPFITTYVRWFRYTHLR